MAGSEGKAGHLTAEKLFLVGFMAAGKTTFGKKAAASLGWPFFDLDQLLVAEHGISIPEMIHANGEPWFRQEEAKLLRHFSQSQPAPFVLATGGGAPMFEGNMDWMNAEGITVFLNPPWHMVASRLKLGRQSRPLLAHADDWEAVALDLFSKREPVYRQAAITLEGDRITPADLIAALGG